MSADLKTGPHYTLECPKCGKYTVVQQDDNVYSCINCDFTRDLNDEESDANVGSFLFSVFTVLLLVLLMV
jgi:ribosomal protein L37AE/L43A